MDAFNKMYGVDNFCKYFFCCFDSQITPKNGMELVVVCKVLCVLNMSIKNGLNMSIKAKKTCLLT